MSGAKARQVLGAMVVLIAAIAAQAQLPSQFSADMSMKSPRGPQMNGKMYVGNQKFRMEMTGQGRQSVMINDIAAKTVYIVVPEQKMYMEYSLNNPQRQGIDWSQFKNYDPSNPCAATEDYTCRKEGSETVNGRS